MITYMTTVKSIESSSAQGRNGGVVSGNVSRIIAMVFTVLAAVVIVAGATGLYAARRPVASAIVPVNPVPAVESPIPMDTVFVRASRDLSADPIVMDTVYAYIELDQAVRAASVDVN
jgi:hypothetical protein